MMRIPRLVRATGILLVVALAASIGGCASASPDVTFFLEQAQDAPAPSDFTIRDAPSAYCATTWSPMSGDCTDTSVMWTYLPDDANISSADACTEFFSWAMATGEVNEIVIISNYYWGLWWYTPTFVDSIDRGDTFQPGSDEAQSACVEAVEKIRVPALTQDDQLNVIALGDAPSVDDSIYIARLTIPKEVWSGNELAAMGDENGKSMDTGKPFEFYALYTHK